MATCEAAHTPPPVAVAPRPSAPPTLCTSPLVASPSSSPSLGSLDRPLASRQTQHLPFHSVSPTYIDAASPSPSPVTSPPLLPPPPSTTPASSSSPTPPSFPSLPSHTRRSSIVRLEGANVHVNRNVTPSASTPQREKAASMCHDVLLHQLPSLLSPRPIRRAFARNLDNVVRGVLAFIVAATVAVQPWSTELLAVPYLAAMFTAGMVRPTVGSTLMYIDTQGKGVLAAAVLDVIIMAAQVPQLSSTSRILTVELLLFLTSTLLSYYFAVRQPLMTTSTAPRRVQRTHTRSPASAPPLLCGAVPCVASLRPCLSRADADPRGAGQR